MIASVPLEARILDVMQGYHRVGVASATTDTIAKVLHAPRREVSAALLHLMKAGRIEYARKNPRSAQPRYRLKIYGGAAK